MNIRHHRADELALTLYVPCLDSEHQKMVQNLREAIEQGPRAPRAYSLDVIDVSVHPETAREHAVYATPTLVRVSPGPERRIVGDLRKSHDILAELVPPVD